MRDIARLAGVSPATVSRVINGSARVSPDTRERILALVRQHHYIANPDARRLRHPSGEPAAIPWAMRDIARLAGVSTSTVSRALKGDTRVSAEARQRIEQWVQRLGYQVNAAARKLRVRP